MLIKLCGLRSPENIDELSGISLDLLGFVFHRPSPRYVGEPGTLAALRAALEAHFPETPRVGVFVNAKVPDILQSVSALGLTYAQLHGDESPEYCASLRTVWPTLKLIKAFSVDAGFDFKSTAAYERFCEYFLFDTKTPARGGSGQQFDWSILEKYTGFRQFLLSGGIGPDDAAQVRALNFPQMAGVDVNSKFETEPGVKDAAKVRTFVNELNPNKQHS